MDASLADTSVDILQSTENKVMHVWREDLEQAMPAFIWEEIARQRTRSDGSEEDGKVWAGQANLNSADAVATPDSYERYFSYEPIKPGDDLREYLELFPSKNSSSFELILTEPEKRGIMGTWTTSPYSNLNQTPRNGIIDQYTGKRIFLRQMSTTKIRKDLYYMWQMRLYSDIQIVVPLSKIYEVENEDRAVHVLSCHRSILVARSPYFREILLGPEIPSVVHQRPVDLFVVPLPSPPFTPTTLDFTFRFLYTGTLQFPHPQFTSDYSTTIALYRAALFLRVPSMKDLIVAHIITNVLHGSFSGAISSSEYYQLTEGRWKRMSQLGGCSCRQCARRAPRVLAFSLEPDIQDIILERGSRRALVGMFGPGWCTQELGSLPNAVLGSLLASLKEMVTPRNALSLLFAAEEALAQLGDVPAFWDKPIRLLVLSAREHIVNAICRQPRPCFYCDEWKELISDHPIEVGESFSSERKDHKSELRMTWILSALFRATSPQYASAVYQTLTWFTDAQVLPENQNKRIIDMMAPLKEELFNTATVQSRRTSVISADSSIFEPIDPLHRSVMALDLSNSSVYSHPSSRTMSTEYGIYYTRMALSQETMETALPRRRRSWDTLSVYTEI